MKKQILALTFLGMLSASVAVALPAVEGTPGSLPGNLNFGGTDIPDHHVMLDTYQGLTIGLTAHQRYAGPNLANDGNGTFFASTGESSPGLGLWNFGFQLENPNGLLTSFSYKLTFGSDPANYISFNPYVLLGDNKPSTLGGSLTTSAGNSQNLGFYTSFISYNPNAAGTYAVVLEAFDIADTAQATVRAKSAINIQVTSSAVPDAGSTLALMGAAFIGIAGLRRKFNA